MSNFFDIPKDFSVKEQFETLLKTSHLHIERIISPGQDKPGVWYDQEHDEWVMLVQGRAILEYENGSWQSLEAGDYLFIPAHQRHRVIFTSEEPLCFWLAIHGNLQT